MEASGECGVERLLLENVESRAPDLIALQCVDEGRLVDDGTARGVDEHGIGLHERELRRADQAPCLRSERAVDEHVVGRAQELVERDQLDAELGGALRGGVRVEGEKAADVEGAQQADRFRSNVAHADRTDDAVARFAAECARALGPAPLADLTVLDGEAMRKREHKEQDGFRNRTNHATGRDVDGDAVTGAGFEIDIVVTHAAAANGAEARIAFERLRRDARPERNDDVITGQLIGRVLGLVGGDKFTHEAGVPLKSRQADVGKDQLSLFVAKIRRQAHTE